MPNQPNDSIPTIDQPTPESLLQTAQVLRDWANRLLNNDLLKNNFLINFAILQQLVDTLPNGQIILSLSEAELIAVNQKLRNVCYILRTASGLMTDIRKQLIASMETNLEVCAANTIHLEDFPLETNPNAWVSINEHPSLPLAPLTV